MSGLSRLGLLLLGISRWLAIVMAGGPSVDWVVAVAGVHTSLRFVFESDTVMVLALEPIIVLAGWAALSV